MATGTVSSVTDDVWQLISSSTVSSGTSVSFTSISGYKRLMVSIQGVTKSGSAPFYITVNSDTTNGNYHGNGRFLIFGGATSLIYGGVAIIENINQAMPHTVSIITNTTISGAYVNPVEITSVQIWSDSPAGPSITFTGGTVALYGIAA